MKIKVIDLQRSVFFNEGCRRHLHEFTVKSDIGRLASEKPKEIEEAAERLAVDVKDDSLKKELKLVASIAKLNKIQGDIAKEEIRIYNLPKHMKESHDVEGYHKVKSTIAERLNGLNKQRSMTTEELQERLKKELV